MWGLPDLLGAPRTSASATNSTSRGLSFVPTPTPPYASEMGYEVKAAAKLPPAKLTPLEAAIRSIQVRSLDPACKPHEP